MSLSALPDVLPLVLTGDEDQPRRHARRGTGLASLVLGALILTGYSGIVPPLVET